MAGELSIPTIFDFGHLSTKICVLLPGPQPISIMFRGLEKFIREIKSIDGCVLSL
jgi:hypothetical protein